jgi:hypothetical protein
MFALVVGHQMMHNSSGPTFIRPKNSSSSAGGNVAVK